MKLCWLQLGCLAGRYGPTGRYTPFEIRHLGLCQTDKTSNMPRILQDEARSYNQNHTFPLLQSPYLQQTHATTSLPSPQETSALWSPIQHPTPSGGECSSIQPTRWQCNPNKVFNTNSKASSSSSFPPSNQDISCASMHSADHSPFLKDQDAWQTQVLV